MKRTYFLFVLLLFILLSCKKDKKADVKEDMKVFTVTMTPNSEPFNLDLDSDGSFDIRINVVNLDGPGPLWRSACQVICLNTGLELLGYLQTDTLFLNKTFSDPPQNSNDMPTCFYHYLYHRVSPSDSIITVLPNTFKLKFLDTWQKSPNTDAFKNDSIILQVGPNFTFASGWVIKDSVKYQSFERVDDDYAPFPANQTKYLGLKLKSKDGYIKFTVTSDYKINVFEAGISN